MTLRKRLKKASGRAAQRVMSNEKAMGALFQAFGKAQAAKKSLNQLQSGVLHQMAFASRGDYQALGKRISALKRKVKELGDRIGARAGR